MIKMGIADRYAHFVKRKGEKMKRKICSIICVICLLFGSASVLSSCGWSSAVGVIGAQINESGELVLVYSDGSEQNLGIVVGKDGENGDDASLVITANGSSIPAASSKGLLSAVSIVCNFQVNVQQGGWRPGSALPSARQIQKQFMTQPRDWLQLRKRFAFMR